MSARNNVSNGGAPQGALTDTAISFAHRHTHSEAFKTLFREGMNLVEEAAFGRPQPKAAVHVIGENVDALSAPELAERIELCRREIERLEAARAAREATRAAADVFFKR